MNLFNKKLFFLFASSCTFIPLFSVNFNDYFDNYVKKPFNSATNYYGQETTKITPTQQYLLSTAAITSFIGFTYGAYRLLQYFNEYCLNHQSDQHIIKYAHSIHCKVTNQYNTLFNYLDAYDFASTNQQKIATQSLFKNAILERTKSSSPFLAMVDEIKSAIALITKSMTLIEKRVHTIKISCVEQPGKHGIYTDCVALLTALKASMQKIKSKLERLEEEISGYYEYKVEVRDRQLNNRLLLYSLIMPAVVGALVW